VSTINTKYCHSNTYIKFIYVTIVHYFINIFFSDRFRTTVNVLGDAYGAGIVAKLAENDLELLQSPNEIAETGGKLPNDEWNTTSM